MDNNDNPGDDVEMVGVEKTNRGLCEGQGVVGELLVVWLQGVEVKGKSLSLLFGEKT